jgi:cell wall-associated NlpC family hydrolase
MATFRTSFPRPNLRSTARRVTVLVAAAIGVAVVPLPAAAAPAPGSAQEAAALMAARSHDLEAVTEQYNDARATLESQQAAADSANATLAQAQQTLAAAQAQVVGIARSAFTSTDMSSFAALMTSDSADEFVSRVSTLDMVAGHQNEILGVAAAASQTAAAAQIDAAKAAADAKASFDKVAAQQADLQKQIAAYQADFDRLSAAEKRTATELAASHGSTDRASRTDRVEAAPSAPVVANGAAAQKAVDAAMAQRGKPYVWAAAGPGSYDCSGLVLYAYKAAGIGVPHSSLQQSRMGQAVTRGQLQPGDLIFFYSPVSHVGIYIGNGQMVHAPTSGDVVKVASIDAVGAITAMRRIAG